MYWVVQETDNPTTDYYIKPFLQKHNHEYCCKKLNDPILHIANGERVSIIFVRYISPAWRKWIKQNSDKIEQVIFFMDDDLFDLKSHKNLPLRYRWKLFNKAFRFKNWLNQINAKLWVSTPWLQNKYSTWQPAVLAPTSPYVNSSSSKVIFYHGSASHKAEILWLYPVIKAVLEQDPSLVFEIIGDKHVRALFKPLSRVYVVHPMSWQAYKAFINTPGRFIGLAPLLDNAFNDARAYVKFFDITQAGAVGIYADHPVYKPMIKSEVNGILLAMDQQAWIDTILRLSHNK